MTMTSDEIAQHDREGGERIFEMNVPRRYASARTDDQVVLDWARAPHDVLYLTGPIGSGKTWLAWAAVHEFLTTSGTRGHGPYFYGGEVVELMRLMRPGGVPEDQRGGLQDPLVSAQRANLLLLDDLGVEKGSEWVDQQLYAIVNARYNAELPTIITTNRAPADLKNHVEDRVASRLAEGVTVVPVLGTDRRRAG